jgi:tight adherence protein C
MMAHFMYLIAVLGAGSAFMLAISLVPRQSQLSVRLAELEGRSAQSIEKAAHPIINRMLTDERRSHLRRRLSQAGWYAMTPSNLVLRVVGGALLGASGGMAIVTVLQRSGLIYFALVGVIAAFGAYLPISIMNRAIDARKRAIQRALPDLLDMLASTVQAGLALNAALVYAADATMGPLGEELKAALAEIQVGRGRAEALTAMARRVQQHDLSTTVRAMVQAERLGANLAQVLAELADDTRLRRMVRAEEIAMQLPVKMTLPMAVFMLPALFVMIFGPVVANYMAQGGGKP